MNHNISSNNNNNNNNNNHSNHNNNITSNYDHLRRIAEPVILFSGIVFNLALVLIVYAKKRTKGLRSTKPLRYLLISMLVSDTWYLVSHVNVWYYFIHNKADLSSLQVFCQLNTYFNYFFAILLEFNMLAADWIILRIVFKSTAVRRSRERAISVYNQFQVPSSSSAYYQQQRQRQQSTSAFVKAAAAAVASSQGQSRSRNKSISGRWAARLSVFFPGFGMQRSRSVPVMIQPDKSVTSQLNDIETINEIASSEQQAPNGVGQNDRTTRKSTLVSTTNLIGGINTSTSLIGNNAHTNSYSTSNNDDDKTFAKRANFFNLIMDYNFKNESAYFDIILKEKVAIILNFFVWMYLLSFLLWIRGVDTINTDLSELLQLSPSSSSTITTASTTSNTTTTSSTSTTTTTDEEFYMFDDSNTTTNRKSFLELLASQLAAAANDNNNNNNNNNNNIINININNINNNYNSNSIYMFEPSVKSFCFTHKFALSLFRVFVFSVAVLRLVTMFANFLASICFHFKFRHEYYNAFRVSFKDKNSLCEEERDGGSRILSYKSFQTWVSIKEASKLNRRSKKYSNMSETTTAVAASAAATTAVAAATTSATSATGNAANAATAAAAATTLKNLDTKRLESHYSHFHFIRHYALVTFFYACICAPSILADTVDTFKDVYRNLVFTSSEPSVLSAASVDDDGSFNELVKNLGVVENKENTGKILINLSECLAHSFKLLVYVLFSTHLNCHFRFVRRRNNKLRGANGGGNSVGVGGSGSGSGSGGGGGGGASLI